MKWETELFSFKEKGTFVPLGHRVFSGDWAPRGNVWGLIVTEVL